MAASITTIARRAQFVAAAIGLLLGLAAFAVPTIRGVETGLLAFAFFGAATAAAIVVLGAESGEQSDGRPPGGVGRRG